MIWIVAEKIFILLVLLAVLGKSAAWAIRSSVGLSRIAGLSEFVISVVVITLISILPETIIAILAAAEGSPALGLGTIIGSNVTDLTLVFGMVALFASHAIGAEPTFIKEDYIFLGFLLLPLVLGFTGVFSRLDGVILIAAGIAFFFIMARSKRRRGITRHVHDDGHRHTAMSAFKDFFVLAFSLTLMGASAYYAVQYADRVARIAGLGPALIGLLIVAPGTCLPELVFAIRAVRRRHSTLAFGDILGTVVIDATLVLGVVAFISPFVFNPRIIIVTGIFMLAAGMLFFSLIRSGRQLTHKEGLSLLAFYAFFIMVEFATRNWTPLIVK
jgi:cation:H+ antiporter